MSTETLTPVPRPDGRAYRPRKAPEALITGYDGDIEGVIVLRTHDVDRARRLAVQVLTADVGGPDEGWELTAPDLRWGHFRPDRATDGLMWMDHEDGSGTPAVWFSVEWS